MRTCLPFNDSDRVDTSGAYSSPLLFDGSQFGLAGNDVNAIDLPVVEAAAAAMASLDANRDGDVSALDALVIINQLGSPVGEGEASAKRLDQLLQDYDTNGDGKVSALDALIVVNHLSSAQKRGDLDADAAASCDAVGSGR